MPKHLYSLVHLTNINCPPPQFIYTAAKAGYDAVSLRTIPLGLPGESPYNLAQNPQLMRETRQALSETGIRNNLSGFASWLRNMDRM